MYKDEAYTFGFCDGYNGNPNNNPYNKGSKQYNDYEDGYDAGQIEEWEVS